MARICFFAEQGRSELRSFYELLRKSERVFETTVKGASMEPTIPDGARIQIRPRPIDAYANGQVVACVASDELFAHRVVFCGSRGRSRDLVITLGDNLTLCDPPTRKGDILGEVTALWQDGRWRAPVLEGIRGRAAQALSNLHLAFIRACLPVHYEFARRVTGISLIAAGLLRRVRAAIARP